MSFSADAAPFPVFSELEAVELKNDMVVSSIETYGAFLD